MMDPTEHGGHKAFGSATYRQISGPNGHLAKREPFEGHSMRAEWECHSTEGEYPSAHDAYVVYSYDQVIAIYDPQCWGPSGLVIDPYNLYGHSQATSRHINITGAWLSV